MPKPFDASTKFLIELAPEDWLRFLKLPIGPSEMVEADLSTITAAGDRILKVNTPSPYGLHVEFQAGPDEELVERAWEYNVLYTRRLKLPVETTASGRMLHDFTYQVIRVWELPPEVFLEGGSGLLPLAPVAHVSPADVPYVIQQLNKRLESHYKPSEAEQLRTATFVLMGLKYPKEFVEKLMSRNVLELSSTYQALIQEGLDKGMKQGLELGLEQGLEQGFQNGELQEAREMLLRFGRRRLGEANEQTRTFLEGITSVEILESFADRLWDIESWQELR